MSSPTNASGVASGATLTPNPSATSAPIPTGTLPVGPTRGQPQILDIGVPLFVIIAIGLLLLTGLLLLLFRRKSLRLRPSYRFDDLGFVLMKLLQLDAAHGLNLKLAHQTKPGDAIEPFRNGATDVLLSTPDIALQLAADGEDVCVIYAYSQWADAVGLAARADIQAPIDLRGRTVGAGADPISQYLLVTILKNVGLTMNEVAPVTMLADDLLGALASRRVDAVVAWGPTLSAAASLPGMRLLAASRDYPNLSLNVMVVRRTALEAHFDAYRRLVEAWDSVCAEYQADPARCQKLLADDQGRTAADLVAAAAACRFLSVSDNRDLLIADGGARMQELLQNAYALLRASYPAWPELDPTTLYDPTVVRKAQVRRG